MLDWASEFIDGKESVEVGRLGSWERECMKYFIINNMERTGALIQGCYGEYIGTRRLQGRAYRLNKVVVYKDGASRDYVQI